MVQTTCAVSYCKSSSYLNKDLRFHQLPHTEERCKLWLEACRRPDLLGKTYERLKNIYVCSLHFENGMYGKRSLKKTALPTLLLPKFLLPTHDSIHTQTDLSYLKLDLHNKPRQSDVRRTKIKTNEYPNLPSSSVPSTQNILEVYSSKKLKERTPSPEIKLEPKTEIREKENDKCCCCLREEGDRSLWSSEENSGDNNVYGKLLEECFNITIGTQMLGGHTICNKCKEQLKQALQFKRQVLECQQRLTESWTTESQPPDYDKIDENPLAALERNKEVKEEPLQEDSLSEEDPDPVNVKLEFFLEPKEEIESVVSTTDESRINEETAIPDCNKLNTNTVKFCAVEQMDEEMLPESNIIQDITRRGQHMLQSFNEQMPAGKSNPQLKSVRKPKRPHTKTVSKTNKVPKSNKRAGLSADSCC